MVTKCLLGKLLFGEYRAVVYTEFGNTETRSVIDFSGKTLLEIIHYLELTFGVEKEKIERVF